MIVFSDDFESYPDSSPADFSGGRTRWVILEGPSRIRTTPSRIFGSKVWQTNQINGSIRSVPITVKSNTKYLFLSSVGLDASTGELRATLEYDLLIGTDFSSSRSVWGSPQTELVRARSPQPVTPTIQRVFSTT